MKDAADEQGEAAGAEPDASVEEMDQKKEEMVVEIWQKEWIVGRVKTRYLGRE